MSLFDNLPTFAFFAGIRYEAYGDRMRKQVGALNLPWGIPKAPAPGTATAGSSGSMVAGTYKVLVVGITATGYKGQPYSDTPLSVTVGASGKIAMTNLPVFASAEVAWVAVYRTTKDTSGPFYLAARVRNGTTSIDLNGADESLDTADLLEPPESLADDETAYAGPFRYTPPPAKTQAVAWDGRIFVFGERDLRPGKLAGDYLTAGVIDGSEVMVFEPTVKIPAEVVGKTVVIDGEDVGYRIAKLRSPNILELDQPYRRPAGVTSDPAGVSVSILGDLFGLQWSETDGPEYFPPENQLMIGREDGGRLMSGTVYMDELLVASEANLYRVHRTGSTVAPYGYVRTDSPVGCPAPRSMVAANGAVYFFSGEHFWIYRGGSTARMDHDLGDLPESIQRAKANYVRGVRFRDRIFWAVPVESAGDYLDQIWVYDPVRGFWDLPWTGIRVLDMAAVLTEEGEEQLWIEGPAGSGYTLNRLDDDATTDGVGTADYSGTVAAATTNTLACAAGTFPVTGAKLAGLRAEIVSGTGLGQVRSITDNTAYVLTLDAPWGVIPDSTSAFTIGAITAEGESGHLHMGRPHDEKMFLHLELGTKGERDE